MENVWTKAAFIRPPRIAGRLLYPFSAHHAMALQLFNSPYVTGDRPSFGDFVMAWLICQSRYDDNLKCVERFERSFLFRSLVWVRLFPRNRAKLMAKMAIHVGAYLEHPEFWSGDDATSGRSGVEWSFKVAATVWGEYHCTECEAWDMPLSRAHCYVANIAENNGAKLLSPDDERGLQMLEEGAA